MTHSQNRSSAFDDIGPSTLTRAEIARRIRRAREELDMAQTRLDQDEFAAATRRLQRAAEEAAPASDD